MYWAHLIQLFKLHHLKEDVLEDVFGVLLVFIQLSRDAQDVAAFPHVKLEVVVGACANHSRLRKTEEQNVNRETRDTWSQLLMYEKNELREFLLR